MSYPHIPLMRSKEVELSVSWVMWICVCALTLGFPAKYRERLRLFEDLCPLGDYEYWSTPPVFSDAGGEGSKKSLRQKQQEEWDRLNIAVSVITATSAAALAIQATSNTTEVYWPVTAFYSTAFGLSLQGLILITYLTIAAGGSSDEAIGRLAQGTLMSKVPMSVRPVALMMALPAILATYSSLSLLVGLAVMVIVGPGPGIESKSTQYILVTMIPIGIAFVFLCISVVMCEVGTWIETQGRRRFLNRNGRYKALGSSSTSSLSETLKENLNDFS